MVHDHLKSYEKQTLVLSVLHNGCLLDNEMNTIPQNINYDRVYDVFCYERRVWRCVVSE